MGGYNNWAALTSSETKHSSGNQTADHAVNEEKDNNDEEGREDSDNNNRCEAGGGRYVRNDLSL